MTLLVYFGMASRTRYNIIQLIPALKVNIIIVHPWDVVFSRALPEGCCFPEGKQHPKGEQL